MSENENEAEIIRIFEVITAKILPADKKNFTDTMTTADFLEIYANHFPAAKFMEASDIYNLLIDYDYKYELIANELVWLVKKV